MSTSTAPAGISILGGMCEQRFIFSSLLLHEIPLFESRLYFHFGISYINGSLAKFFLSMHLQVIF